MSAVADRSRRDWLAHWRAMTADELRDERFRLYDVHEIADDDSELAGFCRWALRSVEVLADLNRREASLAVDWQAQFPDLDARAMASAVMDLAWAGAELRLRQTPDELFDAALEIAARLKERNPHE